MQELKDEIIALLQDQPDMLACLLRKHTRLGSKLAAWFAGEKPVLLIGGEPGMGKSLLMGNLTVQYRQMARSSPALNSPLALISYDRVHFLFLQCLAARLTPGQAYYLPAGETHPEARRWISQLLQDLLHFAMRNLAPRARIMLEAPLIGQRGENLLVTMPGLPCRIQVFILYSPVMWAEVLQQPARSTSAHAPAMRRIRAGLLAQRAIFSSTLEADQALQESWEVWLQGYDGCLLTWNPQEDRASYAYTRALLETHQVTPDPLYPELLEEQALVLIEQILARQSDFTHLHAMLQPAPQLLADAVQVIYAPAMTYYYQLPPPC